jgi:translin
MENLPEIIERIHQGLEARTRARDQALAQARALTRFSAHAVRAIHRGEHDAALQNLDEGRKLVRSLQESLAPFPELFYAGYTQDAIKEFAEANLTVALIENQPLPSPEELEVEYATYLNGLAEAAGELRRRCLDIIRQGYNPEADRLLACMDDIYETLVTMDYPDAVTNGLRRQTDVTRSLLERTRGDLTISVREQHLELRMQELSARLDCAAPDTPEMDDSEGFVDSTGA